MLHHNARIAVRIICLLIFLFSTFTITISWMSVTTLLIFIDNEIPKKGVIEVKSSTLVNLLSKNRSVYAFSPRNDNSEKEKKSTRQILNELYPMEDEEELRRKVHKAVFELVSYDPTNVSCLQNFKQIQNNTECLFAKRATLWGCQDMDVKRNLEENIYSGEGYKISTVEASQAYAIPFCPLSVRQLFLVIATPLKIFAGLFKKILQILSDYDPSGFHCMNKSYTGKRGWVFEFNRMTFFITTFGPFYPETNSRYSFGCESCFILFQPELSFAMHSLSEIGDVTGDEFQKTERAKIRSAYENVGRPYSIPENLSEPMAWEMIKPINQDDPVIEWWK